MIFSIIPQATKTCKILQENGFKSFLVGGCIRDLLLNISPKDWDITTNALPEDIIKLFPKTYPTGIKHGTVTVDIDNMKLEVTTFRIESDYKDGRHPEHVIFVANIEQDLARRDLTINAMAYDPINDNLVDPFDGLSDLMSRTIRAVGDPSLRFQEDGLRIMRVARFAARFGYEIDDLTFSQIRNNLGTLKKVSKERIKDELSKLLMTPFESYGIKILARSGALETISPILASSNFLYERKCFGDLETKLAYLFSNVQSHIIPQELSSLKFSNKEIKRVSFIFQMVDNFADFYCSPSSLTFKLFLAFVKNNSPDLWQYSLNEFIKFNLALGFDITPKLAKYNSEIVLARKDLDLTGDDLIACGIPKGPQIKIILDQCYREILMHPENNIKSILLDMLK